MPHKDPEKVAAYGKAYRKANRAAISAQKKARRQGPDGEKIRALHRANYRAHRRDVRGRRLRERYGLTLERYEQQAEAQWWECALCRQPGATDRALAVDHDHGTGQVRALLCALCNKALERAEAVPGWGTKADAYIAYWKSQATHGGNGGTQ